MSGNAKKISFAVFAACAFTFALPLSACTSQRESDGSGSTDDKQDVSAVVSVKEWKILEGKDSETSVYQYTTDKKGPKTVIVGGTHGDEVAGWTTALNLVEEIPTIKGVCGEILLIPQANIVADKAQTRCYGTTKNENARNLNRAFPLDRDENAIEEVTEIADAIVNTIETFVGDYRYGTDGDLCIIDLHESIASSATRLGSTLIYSNQTFFMEDLRGIYNDKYREEGEDRFTNVDATQTGSFSYYFTDKYEDAVVFTIETNRGRVNGQDTIALDVRVRQQRNVLNALFDLTWNRT